MAIKGTDIVGARIMLGVVDDCGDDQEPDFRQVPKTDRGNASYNDRGALGSFDAAGNKPWDEPRDIVRFTGYAADETDIVRGFCVPGITEDPAYDKENYALRSTLPKVPNEDMGETDIMTNDWEFRSRNQRSRGFLTRPRIPTERG